MVGEDVVDVAGGGDVAVVDEGVAGEVEDLGEGVAVGCASVLVDGSAGMDGDVGEGDGVEDVEDWAPLVVVGDAGAHFDGVGADGIGGDALGYLGEEGELGEGACSATSLDLGREGTAEVEVDAGEALASEGGGEEVEFFDGAEDDLGDYAEGGVEGGECVAEGSGGDFGFFDAQEGGVGDVVAAVDGAMGVAIFGVGVALEWGEVELGGCHGDKGSYFLWGEQKGGLGCYIGI